MTDKVKKDFLKFLCSLFGKEVEFVEDKIGNTIDVLSDGSPVRTSDGKVLDLEKLYDFYQGWRYAWRNLGIEFSDTQSSSTPVNKINKNKKEKKFDDVNPKQVYEELGIIPNPIVLDEEHIKSSIDMLKKKIEIGDTNSYTREEMYGMIKRLEYRSKYEEHKAFYEKFNYTNQDKIDELLKKHQGLVMLKSTLFVPEFPNDALQSMKEYTEHTVAITGNAPVFYVIAKKSDFEKKERRRDPILLVQSPFGFYWQILGAWDEEMILLEEL